MNKWTFLLALLAVAAIPMALVRAGEWEHVAGRILLQVEDRGEAWYVVPDTMERVYVKNGGAAFGILRTFGLGASNADLARIPLGLPESSESVDTDGDGLGDKLEEAIGSNPASTDTDGDGYADGIEFKSGYSLVGAEKLTVDDDLVARVKGRILLQTESRGEAWYVHPVDGRRYYMADGQSAYDIMRTLSLGITNSDLENIEKFKGQIVCDDFTCLLGAVESDVNATVTTDVALNLLWVQVDSTMKYTHTVPTEQGGMYTYEAEVLAQAANGVDQPDMVGERFVCTYAKKEDMAEAIQNWIVGKMSSDDMNFATCAQS